jgi:uncharacterized protein DUF5954
VAMRDRDLGERMKAYPRFITGGGPDFGYAIQTGAAWRIGTCGGGDPYSTRITLASHLRRQAKERDDPELRRAMLAAAGRLDPEEGRQLQKDEWEIGPDRYRVIRVEKFILIGDRVMEPPRPTDTDPSSSDAGFLYDHPLDPLAPAGPWEAQMRLNLAGWVPPFTDPVPPAVVTEARHGVRHHPGVLLLPPSFEVVEFNGDALRRVTGADGPGQARESLAFHFTEGLPRLREWDGDPATPAELAEWRKAAEEVEASPGPEFTVLGRRFCIVRVSRMIRLGADGPECVRPSDQERYGFPGNTRSASGIS